MGGFTRDLTDPRRIIIVDVHHLFYKFAYGANQLTATIKVDGRPMVVDTTLPSNTIKALHRWSCGGFNPIVVCFDSAGANQARKAYFLKHSTETGGQAIGYKEGRGMQDSRFWDGVNITMNKLSWGGVCVLKADGYEADDLIKAAVDKAKETYPNLPIDIVTGDQDLIPLVDDQVSVFISSRRTTWAEEKSIEKRGYCQITPQNYQSYVEKLSEFKNLVVPYNSVLLKKLLRGKKADNIPGFPKLTPTFYNRLVEQLIEDGQDFGSLFRYDKQIEEIRYRGTGEPVPEELIASTPPEQMVRHYSDPPALTQMCSVLSTYLDDDVLEHVRFIYNGVNLNTAFTSVPERFQRKPAVIKAPIQGYVAGQLQQAISDLHINLPVM